MRSVLNGLMWAACAVVGWYVLDYVHDVLVPRQWRLTVSALGCVVTLALYLWLYRRRIRLGQHAAHGLCVHCGYNLTGNVSGVCPECGTAAASSAPTP